MRATAPRDRRSQLWLVALIAAIASVMAPGPAKVAHLQPGPGKIFFGVSDTGVNSQFTEFSELVGKHPPVIETFRSWGDDLTGSVDRWEKAEARPILHISTADPHDGHELIDPREITNGYGEPTMVIDDGTDSLLRMRIDPSGSILAVAA